MGSKKKVKNSHKSVSAEMGDEISEEKTSVSKIEAKEHKKQLETLKEKQPEFYEYLKEVDKDLLEFDDEGIDDDAETDLGDAETDLDDAEIGDEEDFDDSDIERPVVGSKAKEKTSGTVITMDMVESWCKEIEENEKVAPVRSLLKAFRVACHLAEERDEKSSEKLTTMSKPVMNKVMVETLSKMDGILRNLMKLPYYGGKKEKIIEVKNTKHWKKYQHLVKSYLGNALHALNQMTDAKGISFTLKQLTRSSLFLAAFPTFLRKYIKVALHFWGTGARDLAIAAFGFLRTLCVQLGSDCLDECFKGLYKAYVMNCQFINAAKLQHIQFLRFLLVEFLMVDLPTAYQHAFVFIRQLAMILREALNMKTKEAFRKVYEWKYMNCLELWTVAIRKYGMEPDFKPLAYPLTQIISGVARLVPTFRYFPLRIRCVRMLNCIAAATNTFIPVSMLLLDMLEMKELHSPPTGVRLRSFCKSTKVERFRKDMRELIRQVCSLWHAVEVVTYASIEANSEFTNKTRATISFLPSDPATSSFLEEEQKSGASPLSKYVATLHQRAQQRNATLTESSVLYGAEPSDNNLAESDEDNVAEADGKEVFNSFWSQKKESSSDEDELDDEPMDDSQPSEETVKTEKVKPKRPNKKNAATDDSMKNVKARKKKGNKRKRGH
ncbi:Nucleolar complex protein 2-like protein [Bienertia sinuspersici]